MSFSAAVGVISSINECVNFFQWVGSAISSLHRRTSPQEQLNHEKAQSLMDKLQGLSDALPAMHSLIDRAEWKSHDHDTAKLLSGLKDAVYDAEDLLDEFRWYELKMKAEGNTGHCSFVDTYKVEGHTSHPCFRELFLSLVRGDFDRVNSISQRLNHISNDLKGMNFGEGPQRFDKSFRPQTASSPSEQKIFGRKNEVQKVMELLGVPEAGSSRARSKRKRDETKASASSSASASEQVSCTLILDARQRAAFSVLPIVGIGGAGKTTLAQHVCNQPRVVSHFDLIMWICVSDDFDVERLTKEAIESSSPRNMESPTSNSLDVLQKTLRKNIRGKKFLLILDDIWDDALKEDGGCWNRFCSPFTEVDQGSMILVTTRSAEIADRLGTVKPSFPLESLEDDSFWDFFKQCAFGSNPPEDYPELQSIAKKIVLNLKGSPLAAKTLGHLLRMELDERYWNNILNSDLWRLNQKETDIFPALRLSYIYLPPHLKKCFSFCAVYPKDYNFQKSNLASIWAAQGFIEPQGDIPIEDLGCRYFEDLVNRSFFQPLPRSQDKYVIHDLMHDMAQLVSKDECFIIRNLQEDLEKIPKNVRHLSIFTNSNIDCPNLECLCEYKKLRTLLCNESFKKDLLLPVDRWFSELPRIRVFCCAYIKMFPESVSNLKHLRYIRISKTCHWKTLPSKFCSLYNLQYLYASGCTFKSLPGDLMKLINLKIIESKRLRYTYGKASAWGPGIKLLKHLNHIHKRLILGGLGGINEDVAVESIILDKKYLKTVDLEWRSQRFTEFITNNAVQVLDILHPPSNLKSLALSYYPGESIAKWFSPENLPNLTELHFWYCAGISEIPLVQVDSSRNYVLPFLYLTELTITSCGNLSILELQSEYAPAMKKIKLRDCQKLIVPAERFGDFCSLEELEISLCPISIITQKKVSFPPSLKMLRLEKSGDLSYDIAGSSVSSFYCRHLSAETIPLLSWSNNLPALEKLEIESCHDLVSFQQYEATSSSNMHACCTKSRIGIEFRLLTDLTICYCNTLSSLGGLLTPRYLVAIQRISVLNCKNLQTLTGDSMEDFDHLEGLIINDCPRLQWQKRLALPSSLRKLSLCSCGDISMLFPSRLENLTSLVDLALADCMVQSIEGKLWSKLVALKKLYLSNWPHLTSIGALKDFAHVEHLSMNDCPKLKERLKRLHKHS